MSKEAVADTMVAIPQPITFACTAAEARLRMREEDLEFLPVVDADNGKLLGMVLRGALERACEANGHDPETCHLVNHLKTDVDFCFVQEPVRGVLDVEEEAGEKEGLHASRRRVRQSLPVIVVDPQKVPVGLLVR
ncbi:MAG: CBS domain-containing protein [Gemmatimonadota bacterium]